MAARISRKTSSTLLNMVQPSVIVGRPAPHRAFALSFALALSARA
jgi:hypothetical protein